MKDGIRQAALAKAQEIVATQDVAATAIPEAGTPSSSEGGTNDQVAVPTAAGAVAGAPEPKLNDDMQAYLDSVAPADATPAPAAATGALQDITQHPQYKALQQQMDELSVRVGKTDTPAPAPAQALPDAAVNALSQIDPDASRLLEGAFQQMNKNVADLRQEFSGMITAQQEQASSAESAAATEALMGELAAALVTYPDADRATVIGLAAEDTLAKPLAHYAHQAQVNRRKQRRSDTEALLFRMQADAKKRGTVFVPAAPNTGAPPVTPPGPKPRLLGTRQDRNAIRDGAKAKAREQFKK